MHEILRQLRERSFVLDLGCARGSFRRDATRAVPVRFDREVANRAPGEICVIGDAARLPFRDGSFSAIVANHSLEHFDDFHASIGEAGRVLKPDGAMYVAVPDASTFTDKLYRWLARGGGHVNAFMSAPELAATIETVTGLKHAATRNLCSSLSFLNCRHAPRPRPRRALLVGAGYEWPSFLYVWMSRRLDRLFHWRTSSYGWAFYFGDVAAPIDTSAAVNVCIRCGSGFSGAVLRRAGISRSFLFMIYRCPDCGAANPFVDE